MALFAAALRGAGPVEVHAKSRAFALHVLQTRAGTYKVDVSLVTSSGLAPVRAAPYSLVVAPAAAAANASRLHGPLLASRVGRAGSSATLLLLARDAFGNAAPPALAGPAVRVVSNASAPGTAFVVLPAAPAAAHVRIELLHTFACDACAISVLLDGANVSGSPFVARMLPAEPPALRSATFSPALVAIELAFDRATDRAGQMGRFPCALLLADAAVAAIGNASSCVWTSDSRLRVELGTAATILPGDRVALRTGGPASVRTPAANSPPAAGSAELRLPPRFTRPQPVILAPAEVGGCDAVTLDGSQSHGGGGRALAFRWAVGFGPSNRRELAALLQAADPAAPRLTLNATALRAGERYPLVLLVRNFVGAEAAASVTVSKGAGAAPVLLIAGPRARALPRSARIRLVGRADHSSCATPAGLSFAWQQRDGPLIEAFRGGAASAVPELALEPFTLAVGAVYTLALSASAPGGAAASYSVSVEVASRPLLAVIDAGDRALSASAPLVLDASGSYDPDGSPEPLTFTWSCAPAPCFDDPEGLLVQNAPAVAFPPGYIPPGMRRFDLTVSKDPGPRTAAAHVWVESLPEVVSSVSVSIPDRRTPKHNAGARLVLVGAARAAGAPGADCDAEFRWGLLRGDLNMSEPALRTTGPPPLFVLSGHAASLTPY